MIPVITLNNKGEVIGQQAFNDILTTVEQINRALLATIYGSQLKLTNGKNAYDKLVNAGTLTEAQLTAIKGAADTLNKTVMDAIETFDKAVEAAKA